jgi:hypothetical protein
MRNTSSSVNIIRDSDEKLRYFVTPNAEKTCQNLFENFENGHHSFNLIGSFGTGKSSFIWAMEKSLVHNDSYFKTKYNGKTDFIKIVGDYHSLSSALCEEFNVKADLTSSQVLFDAIYQRYEKLIPQKGLLVIALDEFGKFLEFASKNNPEAEIYFLQKLAEFVNKPDRNILLLTSVHQSIESYAFSLNTQQIQEWKKVKGRFFDLTFNEPFEQLLLLASKDINSENRKTENSFAELIEDNNLFYFRKEYVKEIENKIFPLSSISAYVLAIALQRYGQNERSLFTFLNSVFFSEYKNSSSPFELSELYDYLFQEFYPFLVGKNNPDYSNWAAVKSSIEKVEVIDKIDHLLAQKTIKTIGLLAIFSKASSKLNDNFLVMYLAANYSQKEVVIMLKTLVKHQIIRFSNYNNSYKLFEGTDLDIERAISNAEHRISGIDVLTKLNSHFEFPIIIAKSASYRIGTPRLFEFILSNEAIEKEPKGEIDGYVNLIFNADEIDKKNLISTSVNSSTLYGYFTNTSGIFETLLEIEKTKEVLKDMLDENDRVAIKELKSIIRSNEILLNHFVMNSLYTEKVNWYSGGKEVVINSKRQFNQILSNICLNVYPETPEIQNELFNRHKTSGSIASARRSLWRHLTSNSHLEDLGFPYDKWPAEKTIYYTLLKKTGIHRKVGDNFILGEPIAIDFRPLWNISCQFLDEAKEARKSILDFQQLLYNRPLKLKQGVIDIWIPLFLYLKRGDYALYNDNGFIPHLDEPVLYMITRNPKEFEVKSFELNNLRLTLFNKYRDFLRQEHTDVFDPKSFVESIRPLLTFYRELTNYSKNTKSISTEAINLRDAICKAKDPEKTFFEDMPDSLGYSLKELAANEKLFEDYIIDFQNHIEEIKYSFHQLLNRFELFIQNEIVGKKLEFRDYKKRLQDRFKAIKEHQTLTKHKIFLMRINSNLNERDSFLMSLGQGLIGKPLDSINDSDELVFIDKFRSIVEELDNLVELNKVNLNDDEVLMKFQLTTLTDGTVGKIVRLSAKQKKDVDKMSEKLSIELNKNEKLKIPTLLSMLKKELKKDD